MTRTVKTFVLPIILIAILVVSFFMYNETVLSVFKNEKIEPIRKGDNKDYIAFTCNVDWGTELIPPILDILDKHDVKITFFVTGRWAKNNPETLKMIYDRGHEIGNHGYGHRMHSKIGVEGNKSEIEKTHNIVKEVLGIDMKYFAPPSGDFGEDTLNVAAQMGYKTILWNIDTIDWRNDSTASVIKERVLSKPLKGSIVLMHPKQETVKALDQIIQSIINKEIKVGTISNVLKPLD